MGLSKREWLILAQYSLLFWLIFSLIAGSVRILHPGKDLLLLQNSAFAVIFLGIMTLCTIQASLPRYN